MTKYNTRELLDLWSDGFDDSDIDDEGITKVKCSQCEATAINGLACHEHGCPNHPAKGNDDA